MTLFSALDFLDSGLNLSDRRYFFFLGLVSSASALRRLASARSSSSLMTFPFLASGLTAAFPLNIMSNAKFVKHTLSAA